MLDLLGLFDVAAEAETHRGQQFVGETVVGPAAITREQCSREDVCRNCFLHCSVDRPLSFAAVCDVPGKPVKTMATAIDRKPKKTMPCLIAQGRIEPPAAE